MQPDGDGSGDSVRTLPCADNAEPVSEVLGRMRDQLRTEFPQAKSIVFEFDKHLHLYIDVRTLEEAHVINARLPGMCGGVFGDAFIGNSPHHSFFQRVSAVVRS